MHVTKHLYTTSNKLVNIDIRHNFYISQMANTISRVCMYIVPDRCPLPAAPDNGALACDYWLGGRFCQMQCQQGYGISVRDQHPDLIICNEDGSVTWNSDLPNCMCMYSNNNCISLKSHNRYLPFVKSCLHRYSRNLHWVRVINNSLIYAKINTSWKIRDTGIHTVLLICVFMMRDSYNKSNLRSVKC